LEKLSDLFTPWLNQLNSEAHGEREENAVVCAGYMRHPFKKSLFDNDDYAFQTPFLRTDVLSSLHRQIRAQGDL
jgi:hypothetical protein